MKDDKGRYLTQSLFLEFNFDQSTSLFTWQGEDREWRGGQYFSLKKAYLEMEDPVEYNFATTYLFDWDHWQRLNGNKILRAHFDKWRVELELSLRSTAVRGIIDKSISDQGFQASKWLADRGWDKRAAGRPSKEEIDKNIAINGLIAEEYDQDVKRLKLVD